MESFRHLMTVVLIAGAAAGLLLSAIQHVTVGPLIHRAESYEHAGHEGHAGAGIAATPEEWQPQDGVERTMYTVLGTALTGIAFAAVLFGIASAFGLELNLARGLLLGLLGFACCALAPAIGLPPKPPGAAAADLHAAQIWWVSSAIATAAGLWAIGRSHGSWAWRVGGMLLIALPHLIGAPEPIGSSPVPADLSRQFAIASVGTQAIFWIALGGIGGSLYARAFRPSSTRTMR
jgi:cobalt transporter subunit CbtA